MTSGRIDDLSTTLEEFETQLTADLRILTDHVKGTASDASDAHDHLAHALGDVESSLGGLVNTMSDRFGVLTEHMQQHSQKLNSAQGELRSLHESLGSQSQIIQQEAQSLAERIIQQKTDIDQNSRDLMHLTELHRQLATVQEDISLTTGNVSSSLNALQTDLQLMNKEMESQQSTHNQMSWTLMALSVGVLVIVLFVLVPLMVSTISQLKQKMNRRYLSMD